jgi:glycosyltransferase involved in cell wall biosynthesis
LTRFGPDAVLFSSGNTYEWLSAAAALQSLRNGGVPYAVVCQLNSEQHALDKGKRILARKLFSHAQWVAFVSEHNKRLAERQMGMSLEWAVIVKNPVNLKSLEEIPWPDGTSTVFASIARLDVKYKGQDTLFEVLSRPQWLDREWECRLFGKGPDLLYLSELAEYFGIARRIRFMGHVSDIRQAWKECHMLVLPSHAEGTPLALVEAMLCGRPAVVTDAGGNGEWIQEPVSGFFSEAATTYSFGLAMERAWQSRNNWKKMGDAARDFAIKNFEPRAGEYVANIMERIAEKKNLT